MPALLPSRWTPPAHSPALMTEGLHCPYWRHFMMVPLFYAKVLVKEGFTAVQSDGESLVDMCEDLAFRRALMDKLLKEVPPPHDSTLRADLEDILSTLLRHQHMAHSPLVSPMLSSNIRRGWQPSLLCTSTPRKLSR